MSSCFPDPPRKSDSDSRESDVAETEAAEPDDTGADLETERSDDEIDVDTAVDSEAVDIVDSIESDADGTLDSVEVDTNAFNEIDSESDASDSDCAASDACGTAIGCAAQGTDGSLCDDGDPCTVDDRCGGGKCRPGHAPDDSSGDWALAIADSNGIPTNIVIDRVGAVIVSGAGGKQASSIVTSVGTVDLPALTNQNRVIVERLSQDGSAVISAAAVDGALGWQELPFVTATTFIDTLNYEILIQPEPGTLTIRRPGASQDFTINEATFAQVTLKTDGSMFYDQPQLWSIAPPGDLRPIGLKQGASGRWMMAQLSARTLQVPGSTWSQFSNPDWADATSLRSIALHDAGENEPRGFDALIDLRTLQAIGLTTPQLGREDVVAKVTVDTEVETPAGPATVTAAAGANLWRLRDDGLLLSATPEDNPAVVDQLSLADIIVDNLHQGSFLPRVLPRPAGGFFFVMRLLGTRVFGSAPVTRSVVPDHPSIAIAAFETDGRLAWLRLMRRPGVDDPSDADFGWAATAFAVRADGSFIVGGGVQGELELERSDGTFAALASSDAGMDGFIAMWDRNGELAFAADVAAGPGRGLITALATDVDGSICVAGTAEGTTVIGVNGSAGSISAVSGTVPFVARLDSAGGLDCR